MRIFRNRPITDDSESERRKAKIEGIAIIVILIIFNIGLNIGIKASQKHNQAKIQTEIGKIKDMVKGTISDLKETKETLNK